MIELQEAAGRMAFTTGAGKAVQVIAVTGGKGGVGKTNVSINLSIGLAERGRRVVLLDADLGLANVDVLLGLRPKRNLADVIAGDCGLEDIMLDGPGNIRIIPASSGTQSMVSLGAHEHAGLIHAFSDIADSLDTLIVDTAAGISESVVSFVRAAQECLVVVCDEPSSLTDAYALIKLLNRDHGMDRFRILANQVRGPDEGRALYTKLAQVCDRFLDVSLYHVGDIPYDDMVRKCIQRQRPLLIGAPRSRAAAAFRQLAEQVERWPLPSQASGRLEFFVEQLLGSAMVN
jgi:flagellar biosynthesis protein FlhG